MLNPELVADIVKSIKEKVKTKVTIKCRIGVDRISPNPLIICQYLNRER